LTKGAIFWRKRKMIKTIKWNQVYEKEGNRFTSRINNWEDVIQFFKKNNIGKVLDLGCGNGTHMLDLSQQGFSVTGFDISKSGIELAREKFQQSKLEADFLVGSMHKKFPFQDGHFDAVICLRTLNHGEKYQVQKTINEIWRVIKPGGYIFISTIKIFGQKSRQGNGILNQMPVNFIAPYTYRPLEGKEADIIHFVFNKKALLHMFKNFTVVKFWLDIGEKHWEKYYCLLAQKL